MRSLRFANPVFVALDTPDLGRSLELARQTAPYVGGLKLGLEFITALGPEGVRAITKLGLPVFADVKFHDIPNTVAGASRALAGLGIAMFNVHISGGEAMLRAAVDATAAGNPRPLVLGVTVLTSLDDTDLDAVGQVRPMDEQVIRLAKLGKRCGLNGIVCSPLEIARIRATCGEDFFIATPGIRPAGAALADQRRITTPAAATKAGADIIIVGRPITEAPDPAGAAQSIAGEIAQVAAARA